MAAGSSNGYPKVSLKSSGGSIKAMKKKKKLQLARGGRESKRMMRRVGEGAQKKNFACLIT